VNIKLQEEHTTLTLASYKANFCIFFRDSNNSNAFLKNDSIENQNIFNKKLLNTIYVALKGDICSSPDFDTIVDISIMDNYIELHISGNDPSKFRVSILSFLRLIDIVCTTLFINR
jgi:tRNA threonylcarbamoyladenosine modification (KEOPS) complex  Pcc1 subunit